MLPLEMDRDARTEPCRVTEEATVYGGTGRGVVGTHLGSQRLSKRRGVVVLVEDVATEDIEFPAVIGRMDAEAQVGRIVAW